MSRKTFFLLTSILLVGFNCISQVQKDTLKVLFVGNSYTYYENMPQMVSVISEDASTKLITQKSTAGGARLKHHWLGLRGLKTKQIIENGKFDIVVLQGQSLATFRQPDSLQKYSKLFSHFIKKTGATPYFYLTWAREKTPKRQNDITQVYTEIAHANNGILVPVGEAWALARKWQPNIKLYNPDGSHPSHLGAYLAANIFVATIVKEVPDNIHYKGASKNIMLKNEKDKLFCKKVAREFIPKE